MAGRINGPQRQRPSIAITRRRRTKTIANGMMSQIVCHSRSFWCWCDVTIVENQSGVTFYSAFDPVISRALNP